MFNKLKSYEYLLSSLHNWYGVDIDNDLSVLKTLKLLFLATAADIELSYANNPQFPKTELLIYTTFDNFSAMPLGHVESDVYSNIQETRGNLDNYKINRTGLSKKIEFDNLDGVDTIKIDRAIEYLKEVNSQLIYKEPFELVDLTHKWNSWRFFYNGVNIRSTPIPQDYIIEETKYFM